MKDFLCGFEHPTKCPFWPRLAQNRLCFLTKTCCPDSPKHNFRKSFFHNTLNCFRSPNIARRSQFTPRKMIPGIVALDLKVHAAQIYGFMRSVHEQVVRYAVEPEICFFPQFRSPRGRSVGKCHMCFWSGDATLSQFP